MIPSSLQRLPTLVSGFPMDAWARRTFAGVMVKGRPPVRPRARAAAKRGMVRSRIKVRPVAQWPTPSAALQFRTVGAWRSLVAHLLWEQRVGGSNPLAPTTNRGAPAGSGPPISGRMKEKDSNLRVGFRRRDSPADGQRPALPSRSSLPSVAESEPLSRRRKTGTRRSRVQFE